MPRHVGYMESIWKDVYQKWRNGDFDAFCEMNGGTRSDGVKVIITYNSLDIKGKFYFRPSKRVPCL